MQKPNPPFRVSRDTSLAEMGFIATLAAAIGAFIATFAVLFVAVGVIWRGFVFSVLWSWFVMTQFTGAPDLNIGESIGISLVVGMFTRALSKADATYSLIGPLAALGVGALLRYVFGVGM